MTHSPLIIEEVLAHPQDISRFRAAVGGTIALLLALPPAPHGPVIFTRRKKTPQQKWHAYDGHSCGTPHGADFMDSDQTARVWYFVCPADAPPAWSRRCLPPRRTLGAANKTLFNKSYNVTKWLALASALLRGGPVDLYRPRSLRCAGAPNLVLPPPVAISFSALQARSSRDTVAARRAPVVAAKNIVDNSGRAGAPAGGAIWRGLSAGDTLSARA